MIRRMLTAVALMSVASAAAHADCKNEVAAAFEKQRYASSFRIEATKIGPRGRLNITEEYVLPNRMRQVFSSPAGHAKPLERVLIDSTAWVNEGKGWQLLGPEDTGRLVSHLEKNASKDEEAVLPDFECLGKQKRGGRELLAYQAENTPRGIRNLRPEEVVKRPDRAVHIFYVDPITGLPAANILVRADKLDEPIDETKFSYPPDIRIEAPKIPVQ